MAKISNRRSTTKNLEGVMSKSKVLDLRCKFKLHYPPTNSCDFLPRINKLADDYEESNLKAMKHYEDEFSKNKKACINESHISRKEYKARKMLEKLREVYKINVDELGEHVKNELIMKAEITEREKKERRKRHIEQRLDMIVRLIEEQKGKQKRKKMEYEGSDLIKRRTLSYDSRMYSTEETRKIEKVQESAKVEKPAEEKVIKIIAKKSTESVKTEGFSKTAPPPVVPTIKESVEGEEVEGESLKGEVEMGAEDVYIETEKLLTSANTEKCFTLEKHLESYPKRVIFQDYLKNKVYLQDIKLINTGTEIIHCRYLGIFVQEKPKGHFPIAVSVRDNIKLRPGLAQSTKIRLNASEDTLEMECAVVFETRRRQNPQKPSWYCVPVKCIPMRAIINVSPTSIMFPNLTWRAAIDPANGGLLTKTVRIENTGARKCSFKISEKSVLKSDDDDSDKLVMDSDGGDTTVSTSTKETYDSSTYKSDTMNDFDISTAMEEIDIECYKYCRKLINEVISNIFLMFRFSEKYYIEVPPFSVREVHVKFRPEYTGFHYGTAFLHFTDCHNMSQQSIQLLGSIRKLPLRVEPRIIDLKTCVVNSGVYASTFKVFNESRGPYEVSLKIPPLLKFQADLQPKNTTVQPFSCFDFTLKFYPRASLIKKFSKYFKKDSGIFEFPIIIVPKRVGDLKLDFLKVYVFSVLTTFSVELSPSEINFGIVTTQETVRTEIQLTNHSLAPQEYAFLDLPMGVRVEPNMGFGTILPKEVITLYLLYSPVHGCENEEEFEVTVTTLAEFGGIRHQMDMNESDEEQSFECIWGEDNASSFKLEETYFESDVANFGELEGEAESSESCVEDDVIDDGEKYNNQLKQEENKIREYLKGSINNISEHSFFNRVNLKEKDYDNTKSQSCKDKNVSFSSSVHMPKKESVSKEVLMKRYSKINIITCRAIVVRPRCLFSESVILLPATPNSSFSLYRFRVQFISKKGNCYCEQTNRLRKLVLCKEKPEFEGAFEFHYDNPHIKMEPLSGTFKSGDSIIITIVFKPEFTAEQLRHESRVQKAKKTIVEKRTKTESALSKRRLSRQSTKDATPGQGKRIILDDDEIEDLINLSLIDLERNDLFSGEKSLQELISPFVEITRVRCFVKTVKCENQSQRQEINEMLLVCPIVKPSFKYLGNTQEINFGKTFVGTKKRIFLQVQNISLERIAPVVSILNPIGSFSCPGWLKKLEIDPEHIWSQSVTFAPLKAKGIEKEYFEVRCGSTNIFLIATGESISPDYRMIPNSDFMFMTPAPETSEIKIEIENFNPIKMNIHINSNFFKESGEETIEAEKERNKKERKSLKLEEPKRRMSRGPDSYRRSLKMASGIPEELLSEFKTYKNVLDEKLANVITVSGLDEDNILSVPPNGKASFRIRFTPPPIRFDYTKKYVKKLQLKLDGLATLKELLIVGLITK